MEPLQEAHQHEEDTSMVAVMEADWRVEDLGSLDAMALRKYYKILLGDLYLGLVYNRDIV